MEQTEEFKQKLGDYAEFDSYDGKITLTDYQPNCLTYNFLSSQDQLVVFSEIWTSQGWTLKIDGKEHPLLRANYLLRAALIPAGQHEIVMRYEPSIWGIGRTMALISSLLILLGLVIAIIKAKP